MKTRTYLAAIVLTVLVPLLALSAWGLNLLLEEEKEARLLTVEARARSIALSIDKELVRAEGALRVIGQTDLMSREDFSSLYELMRKTITSPDSWAVLYGADGSMLMHTHHPYGTRFDEGPNTWVPQAIALGKPSVTNLREGRAGRDRHRRSLPPTIRAYQPGWWNRAQPRVTVPRVMARIEPFVQ